MVEEAEGLPHEHALIPDPVHLALVVERAHLRTPSSLLESSVSRPGGREERAGKRAGRRAPGRAVGHGQGDEGPGRRMAGERLPAEGLGDRIGEVLADRPDDLVLDVVDLAGGRVHEGGGAHRPLVPLSGPCPPRPGSARCRTPSPPRSPGRASTGPGRAGRSRPGRRRPPRRCGSPRPGRPGRGGRTGPPPGRRRWRSSGRRPGSGPPDPRPPSGWRSGSSRRPAPRTARAVCRGGGSRPRSRGRPFSGAPPCRCWASRRPRTRAGGSEP